MSNGEQAHSTNPLRTRWTPKPEQITILESIFNSGMVNPPKHETIRIRNMLQRYGPVGDANVFYWFQNRRSRYRRLQRRIQASNGDGVQEQPQTQTDQTPDLTNTIQCQNFLSVGFETNFVSGGMNMDSSYSSSSSVDSELITVFIEGVAMEVRRWGVNVWSMFGGDFMLYDSSGVRVGVNEDGFLVGLQHGEAYYLVSRN